MQVAGAIGVEQHHRQQVERRKGLEAEQQPPGKPDPAADRAADHEQQHHREQARSNRQVDQDEQVVDPARPPHRAQHDADQGPEPAEQDDSPAQRGELVSPAGQRLPVHLRREIPSDVRSAHRAPQADPTDIRPYGTAGQPAACTTPGLQEARESTEPKTPLNA